MNASTGTLNSAQAAVLRWIADGCPAGVMDGYAHRISAAALRSCGLVRITGRGKAWRAEITPAGTAFLENLRTTDDDSRRQLRTEGQARRGAISALPEATATAGRLPQAPAPARPRALLKTDQLVEDVIAAGGVLRVPKRRAPGQPDYEQLVLSAKRFGKVPPGKRLRTNYVSGELEIRLEDAPAGTDLELGPVPVPSRIPRVHPIVKRFRDQTDQHEVSRAALSRCVRILQGLVSEAERRGYTVVNVETSTDSYGRTTWSGKDQGHLVITIRDHRYRLRVAEEKVLASGPWQGEGQWRRNSHYQHLRWEGRIRRYDADATGRLTITVDSGYSREGRPASWSDRKSWTLEDRLPDLLRELEIRAAEDDHRDAEAKRRAEERQRQWELAIERATERFIEAHRAKTLRAEVAAWTEATATSEYLAALEEAHGHNPEAAEWIAWIRAYVASINPLCSRPSMPATPKISPEDLKPFLDGLSPYGPSRW